MTEKQRDSRRKSHRKWRKSRHGRRAYNDYMRVYMAARRAGKDVAEICQKMANPPETDKAASSGYFGNHAEKSKSSQFPPIINGHDELLNMVPLKSPWEPVGDIYDQARQAMREKQTTKPKIIRPDRLL